MLVTYYHRMIRDIFVRLIIYCSPSAGVLHMPAVMHVTPIQLLFTVMNFALFLSESTTLCLSPHPSPSDIGSNNLYLYVDCNNNAIII